MINPDRLLLRRTPGWPGCRVRRVRRVRRVFYPQGGRILYVPKELSQKLLLFYLLKNPLSKLVLDTQKFAPGCG